MTIRLLAQYQGNPPNTIVTLAGGIETALVAAGNASTDLSGGVAPTYITPANHQIGDILYGPDAVALGLADRSGKLLFNFSGITVPGAPTGLTLTPIAGGVLAAFTPSATLGGTVGTGFEVTLSNGVVQRGAASPIVVNSPAGSVTATVKQINGAGLSVASAASAGATVTAYSAPAKPGAPTGLTLVAGSGKVTATWTAAPANGSALRNTVITLNNGASATALGNATTVDVFTHPGLPVTATARANNGEGAGPTSAVSNSVTPTEGAGLTPYVGPISQRNRLPDFFSDKTGPAGAETMNWVFRDSTSLIPAGQEIEMTYTNVLGPQEVMHATNTASAEIECSIEYPQGTFTRFKCNGVDVGVMGDKLSSIVFKGSLAVDLPKGVRFWVGTYVKWTGFYAVFSQDGICRFAEDLPIYRETQTRGVTTTNTCMTGVRGTNLDGWVYYPVSICSLTTEQTFGIVGDSQERGSANPIKNGATDGLVGTAERALKGKGTTNVAVSGDSYAGALVNNNFNARTPLVQNCSHIVDGYGDNDGPLTWALLSGTYGPQMKAKWPNAKYGHLTLDPKSSSTDYYMTVANQTVDSNLAVRNAINTGLRTKAAPAVFDFYVDVASTIETAPNSGLSIVSPNVKFYQHTGTIAAGATGITGAPAGTFSKALHDWHYMVIPGAGTAGADHVVMMAFVSDTAINFRKDLGTFPEGKPTITAVTNPLILVNAKEYMRDAIPHRGVNGEILCNNIGIVV